MTEQNDLGKTSIGMTPGLAAALSYLLGVITGVTVYVLEKENKYVRFHAMQSILFCGSWIVINVILTVIPILGWILAALVNLIGMIFWLVLLYKALSGERFKLPVIGDLAEKNI